MPKKRVKAFDLSSLEHHRIPEKQKSIPLLPLPVNKEVNIDAYVDVDKLKSAIAIQFRNELLKASSTILGCLVCEHINNGGICKICFRSTEKPLPIHSSTYNDNMTRQININKTLRPNKTTSKRPTTSYDGQRPSSSSRGKNVGRIPSWYNLPFNQTILGNRKSTQKGTGDLDEFLQHSFREKFRQFQITNK